MPVFSSKWNFAFSTDSFYNASEGTIFSVGRGFYEYDGYNVLKFSYSSGFYNFVDGLFPSVPTISDLSVNYKKISEYGFCELLQFDGIDEFLVNQKFVIFFELLCWADDPPWGEISVRSFSCANWQISGTLFYKTDRISDSYRVVGMQEAFCKDPSDFKRPILIEVVYLLPLEKYYSKTFFRTASVRLIQPSALESSESSIGDFELV